ncbi:MAG: hypothetical protein FWD71_16660 [Oscillospiraceae bacterium]|nr:hypothetical protein [Oscillospiraceae bacterium]
MLISKRKSVSLILVLALLALYLSSCGGSKTINTDSSAPISPLSNAQYINASKSV